MRSLCYHIKGQGPAIVLLHGWGFNSQIWQGLVNHLENKFTCYLIDLPGHGSSCAPPNGFNINALSDEIINLVPKKSIFIGWSLGGLIAMHIASKCDNQINKLLTIASTPKFIQATDWPGIESHVLEKFHHNLNEDYPRTVSNFIKAQLMHADKAIIHQVMQAVSAHPPSFNALQIGLDILKNTDLRHALSNLTVPHYHLFGRLDTIVPIQTEIAVKKIAPAANTFIFEKAGHLPFISHPSQFTHLLLRILMS